MNLRGMKSGEVRNENGNIVVYMDKRFYLLGNLVEELRRELTQTDCSIMVAESGGVKLVPVSEFYSADLDQWFEQSKRIRSLEELRTLGKEIQRRIVLDTISWKISQWIP